MSFLCSVLLLVKSARLLFREQFALLDLAVVAIEQQRRERGRVASLPLGVLGGRYSENEERVRPEPEFAEGGVHLHVHESADIQALPLAHEDSVRRRYSRAVAVFYLMKLACSTASTDAGGDNPVEQFYHL